MHNLNLPLPISRRLILQQARSQTFNPLLLLVSLRFHVLFHSPYRGSFHLSLAVLFTIGHLGVFSLTRWSSQIHTGFHVPHATRDHRRLIVVFSYWTFTIYGTVSAVSLLMPYNAICLCPTTLATLQIPV